MKLLPSILTVASYAFLVACGGTAATTPTTTPAPTAPTAPSGVGLGDMSNSSAVSVRFLKANETNSGVLVPSTQTASVSGASISAISGSINFPFSYSRLMDDGSVAVVAATGSVPGGTVNYQGNAIMRVSDSAATNYFGEANATLSVNVSGTSSGTLTLSGFEGTSRVGGGAESAYSGNGMRINGLSANSAGLSGGTSVSNVDFGDADFSSPTFDTNGAFAGPSYVEVGGSIEISDTGGSSAQITFAAER